MLSVSLVQTDDEMELQLGCDEKDNDIHDDPNVTESADDPIFNEATGVSEQAGTLGSDESQMQSLLDQMTETLRDSINDRFQSVLHEPLFMICSYLDPRFKTTYEQSSVVMEEVEKKMCKVLVTSQESTDESSASAPNQPI